MKVRFWETARIAAIARLVLAGSLMVALLLGWQRGGGLIYQFLAITFLIFLAYAVAVFSWTRGRQDWPVRIALAFGDVALLLVVVLFASTLPAAFLLFFVYFALVAGLWEGWKSAAVLSFVVGLFYLGFQGGQGTGFSLARIGWQGWTAAGALLAAGTLVGFLAELEHRRLTRREEVTEFSSLLVLDTRWEVLWERFLRALSERYQAKGALLAFRNPESDRISVWVFPSAGSAAGLSEQDRPPRDAHTFLLDREVGAWLGTLGEGEGWNWQGQDSTPGLANGQTRLSLPDRFLFEFAPKSLLTAPLEIEGDWHGRLFLLDSRAGGFRAPQLKDLKDLLSGLETGISTLLTVRSAITRAVNEERDRIVRELHDSVAQALASVEMQLTVFRRTADRNPSGIADDIAQLQQAVGSEREEFRRFLRDLKPLRIPPEELAQRLIAHCGQFQQETGIHVEVDLQPLDSDVREGISREVFLLLRESLHNARKHSGAGRVSVQVCQEAGLLRLTVQDDGNGFHFSGSYDHRELQQKGLAPAALWERVESLGGKLSIDSQPKQGATLMMEIPLS